MRLEAWNIDNVIPYGLNAKEHPQDQILKLSRAIQQFGWDQPIVVDSEGVIIKGHGRRLAAIHLGMTDVPVVVRDDLTPKQVKAARVADNQVALLGDIDEIMLKQDLSELFSMDESTHVDLFDMGFDEDEFDLEALGVDLSDFNDSSASSLTQSENASDSAGNPAETTENTQKVVKEVDYTRRFEVVVECKDESDQETIYEQMTEQGFNCRIMSM